jgi:hypothetical protein
VSGYAFTRSVEAPWPGSCCLYAGRRLSSKRVSPRLIPRHLHGLGFDVVSAFRRVNGRGPLGPSLIFPTPTCHDRVATSPTTLSTTVFSQCTRGWFEASSRKAAPEGQTTSITSTAPQSTGSPPTNPASCVRVRNANRHFLLLILAQSTAGFPTGHALMPHANSGRGTVTEALQTDMAGCRVRCRRTNQAPDHPAQIPHAN